MKKRSCMNRNIAYIIAGAIIIGQLPVNTLANVDTNVVIEQQEKEVKTSGLYEQNYDDDSGLTWTRLKGNGTISKNKDEGVLNIKRDNTDNNLVFIEEQSPSLVDGEAEVRFTLNPPEGESATGRFGIVLRGTSSSSYAFIGYNNGGSWLIETSEAWKDDIVGPQVVPGEPVTMTVRVVGNKVTLVVNGKQIFNDVVNLAGWPTGAGKFGYRTWYDNKDIKIDYLKAGELGSLQSEVLPELFIASIDEVSVETYPRLKPTLPDQINVTFNDGSQTTRSVQWDYIPDESYSKPGNFVVNGSVVGTNIKAVANVTVRSEAAVYETNFETPETSGNWQVIQGGGTATLENGVVKVPMNGVSTAVDMNSPSVKNFIYETDFSTSTDLGRIGLGFRIKDANNWGSICYDAGSWVWKAKNNGQETYGGFPGSFKLKQNTTYRMKLKLEDNNVSLWIDGELIGKASVSNFPSEAGRIGLSAWHSSKVVTLDNVRVEELTPLAPPEVNESYKTIQSDVMKATLDANFPRVKQYEWKEDGSILSGENEQLYIVEVNGDKYIPKVTSKELDKESLEYTLNFEELNMKIKVKMTIKENRLRMDVTEVIEEGETKLQYLNIPGQSLASVTDRDNGKTASVLTTGDWNNIIEEFTDVNDLATGAKGKTYAFINNDNFAVTINNNTIEGGNRVVLTTENRGDEEGAYKKTGISNGTWTYREVLDESTALGSKLYQGELPWSEVMITKDNNSDSIVDWQDAAILYRQNMKVPMGGEDIKNNLSYIAFNIGYTQNPFLRSLDTVKKISNFTDNFGQLVLHKGYQAEGHDDSHPDYGGHIGMRQGGKEDFNTLINEGAKYNAKIGVHINATEYIKDAFEYPGAIVNENAPGWGWLDQAYYVDQRQDIMTGELFRRLDMLKEDAPNLNWVYVDVYTGNGWNAHQLASKINGLGYMLATEMNGPLEQQVPWTHWGGDPAYPNKGNASKIMRFMKNDTQDSFLADPLLKGNKHLLSGGWGTRHSIEGEFGMDVFYNQVLPTKYLQHFPIMKMNDNEIIFENNVKAAREGENINYYRDGRLVATTPESSIGSTGIGKTNLFLPWNPVEEDEKIYHWNPLGTSSEWQLPESWNNLSTVKLYELSDLGRTFVKDVKVKNGKVQLDVEQNTPYLVMKGEVEEKRITDWGQGAQIQDPGFDSQTFDYWNVETKARNTKHVTIENETNGKRKGNDLVKIAGGKETTIRQQIKDLKEGVTYSVSAWVKNEGNRDVTLGVKDGSQEITNKITTTAQPRQGEGVKWIDDTFSRIEVEFTVPKGSTGAEIYLTAAEGDTAVYVDDFRIWDNPGHTNRDGYVFYEDFENVDEGISPFYLAPGRGHSNRSHLAERDLLGRQQMTWVLDGRFSLKTNQQPNETGQMLITEESTFKLEPNKNYELGFIYDLENAEPGYTMNIKSKSQGTLVSIPLDAADNKEVKKEFTTGDINDYYISIDKGAGYKELIVDNIYVKEIDKSIENAAIEYVNLNTMVNEIASGQTIEVYTNALKNNGDNVDLSAATVEYKTSNPGVVTIENGQITGVSKGAADIWVEVTVDGKKVSSNKVLIRVDGGDVVAPEVDKVELQGDVDKANALSKDDYTEESYNLMLVALENAKAILNKADATQEEINNAKVALRNAMDNLVNKQEQEAIKKHLKIAIDYAEELKGDGSLEGVVPAVIEKFNEALDEAKKVYENTNATAEEVDSVFDKLMNTIHMLEFKQGDKTELKNMVDKIEALDKNLYIPSTWVNLEKALENSNKVVADENAMQPEIEKTFEDLVKAYAEIRLKPNKDALDSLIKDANSRDKNKYTEETWGDMEVALATAKKVFDNEEATADEVIGAESALKDALKNLVAKNDGDTNNGGSSGNGGSSNNGNSSGNNNTSGGKLPQTGGIPSGAVSILGLIASALGISIYKKRK